MKKTNEPAKAKKTVAAKPAKPAKQAKQAVSTAAPKAKRPAKSAKPAVSEEIHPLRKIKLTKVQKNYYVDLLMGLRSEFMKQLQFHQDDALRSKKDAAGERPGMATHMADLGSDNFRHDLELGLLSEEGDVVEMIDEALLRLDNDEYGVCLDCGKEINPERLEAKPFARYCIKCKSYRETMEDPNKRHR